MKIQAIPSFVLFLLCGGVSIHQRLNGGGWGLTALLAIVFFSTALHVLDEEAKSGSGTAIGKPRQIIRYSAVGLLFALTIHDAVMGRSWWLPLVLSLLVLFFTWVAGLEDENVPLPEPVYDPEKVPDLSFEEAAIAGSDADFTYYINETFPVSDWKDPAGETLALFQPHLPGFQFRLSENDGTTVIHFEYRGKRQIEELEAGPQAIQVIEPLARFVAPDYVLCSYRFNEGSDTVVTPVFTSEFWTKLKRERPDRAKLFTPLAKHATHSKGPGGSI